MDYIVVSIVCVFLAVFCFFMANKTKKENEQRKKLEEERLAAEKEKNEKVEQINVEIDQLTKRKNEILYGGHAEYKKRKEEYEEYQKHIDALEEERYKLTGQFTSKALAGFQRAGVNPYTLKQQNNAPGHEQNSSPKIDPYLKGVGLALLHQKIAKEQKEEREKRRKEREEHPNRRSSWY